MLQGTSTLLLVKTEKAADGCRSLRKIFRFRMALRDIPAIFECINHRDICKNPLTTRKKCAILIRYKAVMKTRPGESHPERSLFGAMALCMETGGYHF